MPRIVCWPITKTLGKVQIARFKLVVVCELSIYKQTTHTNSKQTHKQANIIKIQSSYLSSSCETNKKTNKHTKNKRHQILAGVYLWNKHTQNRKSNATKSLQVFTCETNTKLKNKRHQILAGVYFWNKHTKQKNKRHQILAGVYFWNKHTKQKNKRHQILAVVYLWNKHTQNRKTNATKSLQVFTCETNTHKTEKQTPPNPYRCLLLKQTHTKQKNKRHQILAGVYLRNKHTQNIKTNATKSLQVFTCGNTKTNTTKSLLAFTVHVWQHKNKRHQILTGVHMWQVHGRTAWQMSLRILQRFLHS